MKVILGHVLLFRIKKYRKNFTVAMFQLLLSANTIATLRNRNKLVLLTSFWLKTVKINGAETSFAE